jgi:uncharacterized protein YjbI with pentapeptide repeats
MVQQRESQWRPTRRQLLWAGVAVGLLVIAILIGYRYDKTLWDWLKLLVVPAVIAGGGIWFNRQQRERELEIARQQRERDIEITDQRTKEDRRIAQERAETDREIADQRRQDDALQAYLDQIGQLLLDKERPLRQSKEDDEVRTLARARTLTVLRRLDSERKSNVLQFLYESDLVTRHHSVLCLNEADLRGVSLGSDTNMNSINLRGANLEEAILSGAYLNGADLTKADLRNASGWTGEQLSYAKSLEGATMPNGKKYEEWLKSRNREEDEEKDGSS